VVLGRIEDQAPQWGAVEAHDLDLQAVDGGPGSDHVVGGKLLLLVLGESEQGPEDIVVVFGICAGIMLRATARPVCGFVAQALERHGDADHGNSPLSIIESPQVTARVG
jgi:hypothetical protein